MRHRKIRELESGGFHVTEKVRNRVYPIGDCREHPGHNTKEEALQCYKEYCLREFYDDGNWMFEEKRRDYCVICGEWGHYRYHEGLYSPLPGVWACEEHAEKETIEEEFELSEDFEMLMS